MDAPDDFVRSGVGSSFSRAIDVKKGDLLYLVVDYQDRPLAGYTIHFHYDPPPPPEPVETEAEKKLKQQLLINVVDAATGEPIETNLTIDGMQFDKVVEAKGKSSYMYEMDAYRNLKIGCVRKGYMFQTVKVKGTMDPTVKVEVRLTPISPGARVILDDIRFVGNEDKVMRQSEASMLMLLRFLQENAKVKIEVEGHVNGPTFKNKKEFVDLSTARAKTVYDFLLVNDVEPGRISYVGLGNSQMLFPSPRTRNRARPTVAWRSRSWVCEPGAHLSTRRSTVRHMTRSLRTVPDSFGAWGRYSAPSNTMRAPTGIRSPTRNRNPAGSATLDAGTVRPAGRRTQPHHAQCRLGRGVRRYQCGSGQMGSLCPILNGSGHPWIQLRSGRGPVHQHLRHGSGAHEQLLPELRPFAVRGLPKAEHLASGALDRGRSHERP
jgi:flagellar motor protein MotB